MVLSNSVHWDFTSPEGMERCYNEMIRMPIHNLKSLVWILYYFIVGHINPPFLVLIFQGMQ